MYMNYIFLNIGVFYIAETSAMYDCQARSVHNVYNLSCYI